MCVYVYYIYNIILYMYIIIYVYIYDWPVISDGSCRQVLLDSP